MSNDDPSIARADRGPGPAAGQPPGRFAPSPYPAGAQSPEPAHRPSGTAPTTDRMATVALLCGVMSVLAWLTIGLFPSYLVKIISLLCGTGAGVAGIVLGHRTRRRIERAGGTVGGSGIARTGFVLGIVGAAMCAVILAIMAVAAGFAVILAPLTDG
jgi:hypothetical protein